MHKRGVRNNHFDSLRWRVDVTARSRDHDELNEPTAIFELRTTPGVGRGAPRAATAKRGEAAEPDVVRFEMSRDEVRLQANRVLEVARSQLILADRHGQLARCIVKLPILSRACLSGMMIDCGSPAHVARDLLLE